MSDTLAGVKRILRDHGLEGCETELGTYIARQRWAGAHNKTIAHVEVVDAAVISDADPVLLHTVTEVTYGDSTSRRYALPIGIRPTGDPLEERAPEFLLSGTAAGTFVYDALGDPAYVRWLWHAIRARTTLATTGGEIRCECPDPAALEETAELAVRHLRVEQSNTSLEIGDTVFLKHLRRVEAGPSHEIEMCDALAAAGYSHIAPLLGRAMLVEPGAEPAPLAMLQPYLHNGTEGWALAMTSLRDLYADAEEPGERSAAGQREMVDDQRAAFLAESARLGRVIAEMHVALAGATTRPAFAPEPLTAATLDRWAGAMTAEFDSLLATGGQDVDPLRDVRAGVVSRFDAMRGVEPGGLLTRVHGDLHLGQMLRVDPGWIVLDFEGEPNRTPAQRRERSSGLRDVAAMLRSFDYAAAAGLAERAAPASPAWEALIGYGDAWAEANRDAFWAGYLEAVEGHGILPESGSALVVRRAFEVQKAVYEVGYELGHRPGWAGIPIRFLLRGAGG